MGEDVPGTGLMINCLLANKTKICNPIKTNISYSEMLGSSHHFEMELFKNIENV